MALLSFETVAERIGRKPDGATRLYLWRSVKAGRFPAPLQLSPARIAWRAESVDAFLAALPTVNYAAHRTEAGEQSPPPTTPDTPTANRRSPAPRVEEPKSQPRARRDLRHVTMALSACADCGGKVTRDGNTFLCADELGVGCDAGFLLEGGPR